MPGRDSAELVVGQQAGRCAVCCPLPFGVRVLRRLHRGSVSSCLINIVEEIEVWGEPEQTVTVAASDFGKDTGLLQAR